MASPRWADGEIVVIDDEQKRVQIYDANGFYQYGFGGAEGEDLPVATFGDVAVEATDI
ncbi:MAG: hypothetical protein R2849_19035 [Thermomicrobiales bacterium]